MGWERSRQHVCKVTCALIYLLSDWMQLSSFPGHCWLAVKLVHYHRSEFWKLEIFLNGNKPWFSLGSFSLWKESCPKCFPEAAVRTGWDYRGKGVTLFTEASFLPLLQDFPWEEKQMNGNMVHSPASFWYAFQRWSGTSIRRRQFCHLEQVEYLSLACAPAASATSFSTCFLRLPFSLSELWNNNSRRVSVCMAHLWQNGLDNNSF